MTVACSMVSFGSSVQVRHGATCQRPMVPAPPVTIASFVGGGPASGTRSWLRWPPAVQMIDTSVVRVHQHGACIADNNHRDMGRSRGGLTSKIHAVVDTNGLPVHLALTPGEAHESVVFDSPQRLASKNDATRRSRIRRRLDQGAC